jgi:hypothetical protein
MSVNRSDRFPAEGWGRSDDFPDANDSLPDLLDSDHAVE